jgi:hypothetical protein
VNRRLSIIASIAMVVVLLACGLTFRAITGGIVLPQVTLGSGGNSATATIDVKATTTAQGASRQLATTMSGAPVFSDALNNNSQHWATLGKTVFFGPDGLHLVNTSPTTVLTEDTPGALPQLSDEVVQVTLAMVQGQSGDLGGLRFFVSPGAAGSEDYYSFVISAQGGFEVWVRAAGNWQFVTRGFSAALRTGPNVKNTIAVVAHGAKGTALLFANGQYLTTIKLGAAVGFVGAPTTGAGGLIVMDSGAEFVFTQYTLYQAHGG